MPQPPLPSPPPIAVPGLPAGAVIYGPDAGVDHLLAAFGRTLAARGFRVAGLVQETIRDPATGRKTDMLLRDLADGTVTSISQKLGPEARGCSLDPAGMAAASAAIREGIATRADLIVVNKFSHAESEGGGFSAELLDAMAEGIPVLVGLPSHSEATFLEITGGHCALVAPLLAHLWRWWGPHRLYPDLALSVPPDAGLARRVVAGPAAVLVAGSHACGLCPLPAEAAPPDATPWEGRLLADLARLCGDPRPALSALALAALCAHHNRPETTAALPALPAAVVPEDPDWTLPGTDAALALPDTALRDRTLPALLGRAGFAEVTLSGPAVPLTPRLLSYGPEALAGMVFPADKAEVLADAVAAGAPLAALLEHGSAARPIAAGG